MFKNKKCSKCNKNIEKKFDFCPYCANPLYDAGDYGLLGINDEMNKVHNSLGNSFAGEGMFGSSFFQKLIGGAMKAIEKEIQEIDRQEQQIKKNPKANSNFQLYINGKPIPLPANLSGIQIEEIPAGNIPQQSKTRTNSPPKVSDETLKNSAKLPRKEPKTKLTRFKEKVVYELDIPGLNSLDKVLVNRLENSIEIKAFTEKAVYIKTFPIKLQLTQYSIKEDKLFLEFKA